jgi:hypothetical protein
VLWRINRGSGFNAPPMTYSVNGKQYIAVASGPCCVRPSGRNANSKSRMSAARPAVAAIRRVDRLRESADLEALLSS